MTRLTSLFADWAALNASAPVSPQHLADALRRAGADLTDEALRALPATPGDAAAALAAAPFADRVDGAYLPFEWLESYCAALGLPIAELDNGWDISDGDDVYFCPRVMLADDSDSPDDKRAFARIDHIRAWPAPA
jgi:hypothetical protein